MVSSPSGLITPCKMLCSIKDDHCTGCLRTMAEIARWRRMTDEERLTIIANLKEREK